MTAVARLLVVMCAVVASGSFAQQPTFHTSALGVAVDVSVQHGGRPVAGLTVRDFQVFDDGVPQTIDAVEHSTTGIDVTCILDVSASAELYGDWLVNGVRDVQEALTPEDRRELIIVGRRMRSSTAPLQDVRRITPPVIGDGGSHVFDAIAAAAMEATEPGRAHAVIVLTDGLDTGSVIPPDTRDEILRRSNAVVDLYAISTQGRTLGSGVIYRPDFGTDIRNPARDRDDSAPRTTPRGERRVGVGDFNHVLRAIADASSGEFHDVFPGDRPAEQIKNTLNLLRHRYILRFRPQGVPAGGWHELKVSVRGNQASSRAAGTTARSRSSAATVTRCLRSAVTYETRQGRGESERIGGRQRRPAGAERIASAASGGRA